MDKEAYKAELRAAMESLASQKPRLVQIDGLGERYMPKITIGELEEQINDTEGAKKNKLTFARGACRLLAYPDGERIYDPDDQDDVALLARQPIRVLIAINKAGDLEGATEKK